MKLKIISWLLLLFMTQGLYGQGITFHYWFDNDFQNTSSGLFFSNQLQTYLSTNGLSSGMHTFNYRIKDANGKWSSVISQTFVKPPQCTTYEYWFDNQFNSRININLPNSDSFNLSLLTPTIPLAIGMHAVHFRLKDQNGKWSSVTTQSFYKKGLADIYEYWFDNNYFAKTKITTSPTLMLNINTMANASNLSFGKHSIHIRSHEVGGRWSAVATQEFIKRALIDRYEYWFDENYATKVSQTLSTPLSELDLNSLFAALTGSGHYHSFHFRTHKQNGLWSTTVNQAFTKQGQITAYEYWFNDSYASKVFVPVPATSVFDANPLLDASSTPLGSNTVHLHFKDANGLWSEVITEGFCRNNGDSSIHLKLFLQGYYAGGGQMVSVLMNQGESTSSSVTDSIDVELHDQQAPYATVATQRVELKTDGQAIVNFPWNFIGNYYLVIKHRNSISTWSSYPIYRVQTRLI